MGQVTSSSAPSTVLEPCLISPPQYIKVLELLFEEATASCQTRNSRFEEEKEKKKTCHPNPSVCNSLFWGSSVTYFPNLFAGAAAEPLLSRRYCYCRATRYGARGAIGFLVAAVCSRACFHPGAWELAEG